MCEHQAEVRDDRARDTYPVLDAHVFMEKWRAFEQGECPACQRQEVGVFSIENFGEVGRRGRIDPEVANGPCSARTRSHHAEVHGDEGQLPAKTYGLNEASTAISAPLRGGENYEPNPEPRATVDSNAVRKQKTPPTVQDDRDPRAGLGRLYRRGEAQNTVANDQCQVLAGRPAHRQGGSAQREAPMCVHR